MKKHDFEIFRDRVDRIVAAIIATGTLQPGEGPAVPGLALTMVKMIDAELEKAGIRADEEQDANDAKIAAWPHCLTCRTRIRVGCSYAFSPVAIGSCPFDATHILADDQAAGLRRLAERTAANG